MSDIAADRGLLSRLVDIGHLGSSEREILISESKYAMLQVIALGGRKAALRKGLRAVLGRAAPSKGLQAVAAKSAIVAATGPSEYWCFAAGRDAEDFRSQIAEAVRETGAVFQQSAARTVLTIRGTSATRVLANGCTIDLDPRAFPVPGAAHTVVEMMPVLVLKRDAAPTFDLAVPNSYAESFLGWLLAAAKDYGYRIDQA